MTDLDDGVQQQALRSAGPAGMVNGQRPGLESMAQIAAQARQRVGCQRRGALLLEQSEQHAFDRIAGCESRMQAGVTAAQTQRQAV